MEDKIIDMIGKKIKDISDSIQQLEQKKVKLEVDIKIGYMSIEKALEAMYARKS